MRAIAAVGAQGLALPVQHLAKPARALAATLYTVHGRPRPPLRTRWMTRQKVVDKQGIVVGNVAVGHLQPAEQRRA